MTTRACRHCNFSLFRWRRTFGERRPRERSSTWRNLREFWSVHRASRRRRCAAETFHRLPLLLHRLRQRILVLVWELALMEELLRLLASELLLLSSSDPRLRSRSLLEFLKKQ